MGMVPTYDARSLLLLLVFLTFSALVASPKKTTLHGGQSRSWSAEQGTVHELPHRSVPLVNLNASRPSEHPPVRGENINTFTRWVGCKDKTSPWYLNGFPCAVEFVPLVLAMS